ncbi:Hypothetical_protein [Hexamita inflata]|uniref:Hypothetical_protein n=1 Tax=Hexamita inflata TaxID=28002 RepID=A0AA86PZ72_9EUKA|nr:Hypothetical protein HINF_LOCUS35261 [Hexamita inflata]
MYTVMIQIAGEEPRYHSSFTSQEGVKQDAFFVVGQLTSSMPVSTYIFIYHSRLMLASSLLLTLRSLAFYPEIQQTKTVKHYSSFSNSPVSPIQSLIRVEPCTYQLVPIYSQIRVIQSRFQKFNSRNTAFHFQVQNSLSLDPFINLHFQVVILPEPNCE